MRHRVADAESGRMLNESVLDSSARTVAATPPHLLRRSIACAIDLRATHPWIAPAGRFSTPG